MTIPSSIAIADTATKKAADDHAIPLFGRLSFGSTLPCCTRTSATCPTDAAGDGGITLASFGSVELRAGTLGVDEPTASVANAGPVSV
jgi:hypothetical protein